MKTMGRWLTYVLLLLFSGYSLRAGAQEEGEKVPADAPMASDSMFYDEDQVTVTDTYSKNYFNEVTATDPVNERKLDASEVKKVRADEAYWYANLAPEKEKEKEEAGSESVMDAGWMKTLFWVLLVGAFVALLVWFLMTSNIRLFSRRPKAVGGEEAENEEITEDIFGLNFEREIEKAAAAKNYRLAVRLHYLQLLRKLSDRGLITYTHEKTNSDYLFQLAGGSYYRDFFRLTRNFEYVWYGKFDLSPELYSIMQSDFSTFKKQIG